MAAARKRLFSGRLSDFISLITLLGALAMAVAWLEHQNAETLEGAFNVVDGDSLAQGERRMRLVGIDAPEFNQLCQLNAQEYQCGRRARDHLRTLINGGAAVFCKSEGTDRYDRLLVECFAGDNSINAQMVADGWALSYGGFRAQELAAQRSRAGLWAGDFERPNDWRAKYGGLLEAESGATLRSLWRRVRGFFE